MTSKAWIVYRHTSPSGKVYIGITSDLPKRRWRNGIHKYASNPYFIKAIQKHGWENFTHEILRHDEACTYEKELIALQFIREYESIRAAERETKIPHQHISDCCRLQKSAGDYIWKFKNLKIMNKNLENIINQLIDYYKELNDLKESGIDISKLAAHKVLYNLYTQMLIDSVGLSRALAIQRYAEYPTCSIEDFNVYLNDQYPERKIVDRPDVKEFEEDAKEKFVRERIESGDYIRESGSGQVVNSVTGNIMESDILEKLSEATKDEKVVKDVCQKLPEYYINGKKVAKEAYDEAMLKVDKIIEKLFKIIDE